MSLTLVQKSLVEKCADAISTYVTSLSKDTENDPEYMRYSKQRITELMLTNMMYNPADFEENFRKNFLNVAPFKGPAWTAIVGALPFNKT